MICERCKCEIEEIIVKRMPIAEVIKKTEMFFDMKKNTLISPKRERNIVRPRMMMMKFLHSQEHKLIQIAKACNKKGHTSALRSIKTINNDIETDSTIAIQYENFLNFINQ